MWAESTSVDYLQVEICLMECLFIQVQVMASGGDVIYDSSRDSKWKNSIPINSFTPPDGENIPGYTAYSKAGHVQVCAEVYMFSLGYHLDEC